MVFPKEINAIPLTIDFPEGRKSRREKTTIAELRKRDTSHMFKHTFVGLSYLSFILYIISLVGDHCRS